MGTFCIRSYVQNVPLFHRKNTSMIDQRIFLIVVPAIFFGVLMFPSHRNSNPKGKLRVNRIIAFCAGSNNEWIDLRAFAFQIGYLSMILWYILFVTSGVEYLQTNAFVLCVVSGAFCIILLRRLFMIFLSDRR